MKNKKHFSVKGDGLLLWIFQIIYLRYNIMFSSHNK